MYKFLQSMGFVFDMDKLLPYEENRVKVGPADIAFFSKLLARYSLIIQPELDEEEVAEIIRKYLNERPLDVHNIHELSSIIKATMYNSNRDVVH
jgi:hypothetical protein